ncbi:MAG: 2-hydroxyglutaryl-CoA dehydratase [Syntrophomonadaceae bacterium]|nr:2-hydroxyglutaryl-CoA dehydratase [Syntrophomonadaceae bacterium]
MSKIGIPRTLAYFLYYPLWKTFLDELGEEVIVSPPTSREILDQGVKDAVNDACIPIKVYHGHAAWLRDKVDFIFSPRLVSVRLFGDFGTETFCPKFLGLPDMVRLTVDKLPPLIDTRVGIKKDPKEIFNIAADIGDVLGKSAADCKKACRKGLEVHKKYQKLLSSGVLPPDAIAQLFPNEPETNNKVRREEHQRQRLVRKPNREEAGLNIAVVGYPYAIYDDYINGGILGLLSKENVQVFTQDMLSDKVLNRQAKHLLKSTFWYFSNRAVYGGLHYMKQKRIDGIIHVTAFACGPDSVVDRLLEIEAHRHSSKPYLSITIDEHTGEAGIRTRVEAFIDMLNYRRDKI